MNNWLSRLSYKYNGKSIKNLMYYICGGMLILYLCYYVPALNGVPSYFYFDRGLILRGQVWRVLSFIFLPEGNTPILFLLSLYFYVWISTCLEEHWGSFRFDVFYLCGVIGCIIGGFITGYTSSLYLNLSLFMAFAAMFPDVQIMLMFIIPIKVKYMAWADAAYYVFVLVTTLIRGQWSELAALVLSVINLLLFFGGDYFTRFISAMKSKKRKAEWERKTRNFKNPY